MSGMSGTLLTPAREAMKSLGTCHNPLAEHFIPSKKPSFRYLSVSSLVEIIEPNNKFSMPLLPWSGGKFPTWRSTPSYLWIIVLKNIEPDTPISRRSSTSISNKFAALLSRKKRFGGSFFIASPFTLRLNERLSQAVRLPAFHPVGLDSICPLILYISWLLRLSQRCNVVFLPLFQCHQQSRPLC